MADEQQTSMEAAPKPVISAKEILQGLGEAESSASEAAYSAAEAERSAESARKAFDRVRKQLDDVTLEYESLALPLLRTLVDHLTGEVELEPWELERFISRSENALIAAGTPGPYSLRDC